MVEFVDTAAGIRLAYETAGSGEPAMLFIHGWWCDRSYFAPQFTHFAAHHAVATLDLRGHGESDRPEPGEGVYDIGAFADDALAVAQAAGFHRPIVVGHSMGGLVALACAARPGAVRAAVMVDPATILDPAEKAQFGQAVPVVANDEDGSWRTAYAATLFLPADTVRREEIIAGMAAVPAALAAAMVRAVEQFDGATPLSQVHVPLLAIYARDAEANLRASCPTITLGQTVGSQHFNQLQVPEQVNLMIERFLAINDLQISSAGTDEA